jgi:hypothetical protein
MVEFSLVLPLFLLVILATIDFSGYFGSRLSVENAARAGARVAVVENQAAYVATPSAGTTIVSAIIGAANDAAVPSNADCTWNGTSLAVSGFPPFTWSTGKGCIGIWYFELQSTGAPALCAQWSVQHNYMDTWVGTTETVDNMTPANWPAGCVSPTTDVVVVGVGYQYSPLTPLPALSASALNTYGETQLLEEQ